MAASRVETPASPATRNPRRWPISAAADKATMLMRKMTTPGGVVVGLSVALALQNRGIAVTIFDAPSERLTASWGNAGHIATEQDERHCQGK